MFLLELIYLGYSGVLQLFESGYPPEKTGHLLRYRKVRTEIAEKLNYLLNELSLDGKSSKSA